MKRNLRSTYYTRPIEAINRHGASRGLSVTAGLVVLIVTSASRLQLRTIKCCSVVFGVTLMLLIINISVVGRPVQSHYHEGSPVGKRSLRSEGFVEKVGFEPGMKK